jgi:hypothetical protein
MKRFAVLSSIRAPFDAISRYRVPISTLPLDSVPALRERGTALDVDRTGYPFWVAFANKYRGAWGMLGVSRIAFNPNRSQALVSTYHACGNSCVNRDAWFLIRSGKTWQIAERIPGEAQNNVEVEPLRYLGVDVSPIAYRPRRVQGVVTDAETGKPLANFAVRVRRLLNTGLMTDDPTLRTDSLGRFALTRLPLNAGISLIFECPNGSRDGTIFTPLAVTPGLDTTITTSFSLAVCNYVPPGGSAGQHPDLVGLADCAVDRIGIHALNALCHGVEPPRETRMLEVLGRPATADSADLPDYLASRYVAVISERLISAHPRYKN